VSPIQEREKEAQGRSRNRKDEDQMAPWEQEDDISRIGIHKQHWKAAK